uniref:Uncharacterized protein n=1 Tax=Tanacetum cinerariifolium TaxID=118510 RepID=A0A6L2N4B9_TANCI|nr:hypothetical protein [Tanacetum cinerariifolium]
MTFEEIEAKFAEVWKQFEDFIPMGSREEVKRLKRKGLNLEQEHVKKQKSSEEAPEMEESTKEITEEKMKEIMQLGEGSDTPIEPHHIPSLEVQQTSPTTYSSPSLPPVTTSNIPLGISTAPLPTVVPTDSPQLRHYTRRARIAQSSALPLVADKPASPLRDVSQGEACPTVSSLYAEQDRANIAKTSTLPHESTSRVLSLAADEGNLVSKFEDQELEITMLKAIVKLLEDREGGVAERSRDDAPIKGRRLDVREEAVERVSDDTEEMAIVSTSMDTTTILSSRVDEVPTSSGKEKMIESKTPKKKKIQEQMDIQMARKLEEEMEREAQRMNEQIARDEEIARIHAEEELQIMIDGLDRSNETIAKYLQEYHQFATEFPIERRIELISDLAGWKAKDFKGMTLEEIKENFDPVWKQIHDFIPISSKEEEERFKRKGIRFEQESVKKLKTSEEVKATEEVLKEKVKEMMQLVLIEEVYVEALQVKHPIIDWKVHTEGQRSYWKITRLGGSSANYQFLWIC